MSVVHLVRELNKHMFGPALAKVFLLPPVKTLHRSVMKLKSYPGFNKSLLDPYKIKVNVMADHSKLWSFCNELVIKENVSYNPERD
jgi:hypothetical protein